MHDEQDITTLKQLFDGIIEIKSEKDKNLIRIVGLSSKPTSWFEYEIDGAKIKILGTLSPSLPILLTSSSRLYQESKVFHGPFGNTGM